MQSRSVSPDLQDDDEVDPGSPIPQDDPEVEVLAELLERMHIATNYIGYHRIFRGPFIFQPSIASNAAFGSIIRPQIHPHPIFRLPPELLCEVFLHDQHTVIQEQRRSERFSPAWIRLTHVCRYWREVGLACPELWAYLRMLKWRGSLQLIDLFLTRSKQALLDIVMSAHRQKKWSDAAEFMTRAMFKEMPRIVSIQLHMPTELLSELLSTYHAAPKLQLLVIVGYDEPEPSIMLSFSPRHVLPSLKALVVLDLPFKWGTQFVRHTLTTLVLSGVRGTPPPQLTDMLDVLRGTPLMESLKFDGSDIVPKSPAGMTAISTIEQPVILRHLQSITFSNVPTRDAVCLFNHITMSPDAIPRFEEPEGGEDNIWLIKHSINMKRSDCAIQSLSIKVAYADYYEMKCWLRHSEIDIPNEHDLRPTFLTRIRVSKQTALDAGHLVRGLQLSEVRTLHFGMPNFLSSSWYTVFGSMKKLKVLYLYGMVAEHLLVVLGREVRPHDSAAQTHGSSQEKPPFLFPALRTVIHWDNGFVLSAGMTKNEFVDKMRSLIAERRCSATHEVSGSVEVAEVEIMLPKATTLDDAIFVVC